MKNKKIGNYNLFKELGKGQFGVVYLAKKIGTDELYAVKQMNRHKIETNSILSDLLKTEVSVMHNITHPNILHLHEFMESKNSYYLVIDYCDNGDLEDHMKKTSKGGFPEQQCIYYLKQIMNGFQELRKHKIMHRDFKLANIFLKKDGTVVIGDFGFAKSGVDMTSTKLGTPLTMAPELLESKGDVSYNSKTDLWSIGVVFYHMLQGEYPFFGMSNNELINNIKKKVHKMPYKREVSPLAKDLLMKLLVIDSNQRISWKDFFNHKIFGDPNNKMEMSNHGISSMMKNALASYIRNEQNFRKHQKGDIVDPGDGGLGYGDIPANINQKPVNEQDVSEHFLEEMTINEIVKEIEYRYKYKNKFIIHNFYLKVIKKFFIILII